MEVREKKKRPKWVWVIAIFYFISAGLTLLSFYLIGSDSVSITPEKKAYFDSFSTFDCTTSILIDLANFSGAITLFLLRKIAFYLFAGALIVNFLSTIWYTLSKGWVDATGVGLFGAMIGLGLLVVVCIYTWKLKNKGILI